MKSLFAILVTLLGLQAQADQTPVFVSCYANAGGHLMLIFDTAQTRFTYRYAKADAVEEFEASPVGTLGHSASNVSVNIDANQTHYVLKAQIITGDSEQPIINTSAQVIFDRDNTGSLKLTSYSLYHLSQSYDLETFKDGTCYVQ